MLLRPCTVDVDVEVDVREDFLWWMWIKTGSDRIWGKCGWLYLLRLGWGQHTILSPLFSFVSAYLTAGGRRKDRLGLLSEQFHYISNDCLRISSLHRLRSYSTSPHLSECIIYKSPSEHRQPNFEREFKAVTLFLIIYIPAYLVLLQYQHQSASSSMDNWLTWSPSSWFGLAVGLLGMLGCWLVISPLLVIVGFSVRRNESALLYGMRLYSTWIWLLIWLRRSAATTASQPRCWQGFVSLPTILITNYLP